MSFFLDRRAIVAALCCAAIPAEAQDAAQMQPDGYRVALENDTIRVLEFHSRPGLGVCGIGIHSHPAHLTVLLTEAKVRGTQNGHTMIVSNQPGDTFWLPPITHETENIGSNQVRALIIEVKSTGSQ
jgi:beta-alanine degradation protein BauB